MSETNLRLLQFRSYQGHFWLKKAFKKLSQEEISIAESFLIEKATLDKDTFFLAVNRMFIDQIKPKNYSVIMELLTCSNSAL